MQEPPRFDNEQDRVAYELGSILRLLNATPYRELRLASIEAQLLPPIRLRQTSTVRGPRGLVLGYASWAYVSDEVDDELARDPSRLLLLPEWNEGTNLWLMEFVALRHRVRELADDLRARHCGAHAVFSSRRGRRIIRMRLATGAAD